jgi:hypothetical protein
MAVFDVFNGDADGICALHQLRLAAPTESTLVTGVKRDIKLLTGVKAGKGDQVNVMDISLDKNRGELVALLENGASVTYFDHHFAGEIPQHPNLDAHIDTSTDVCSSLLVNDYLGGKFLPWAVTAAFGDNLFESAVTAAKPLDLNEEQLNQLKELGTLINYNGYGAAIGDLHFPPAELYHLIKPYEDPFDFINQAPEFTVLREGYLHDLQEAESIKSELEKDDYAIYILPNAPWARRVSGVFANGLAQRHTQRAHAILSVQDDDSYLVSVRAPLQNKQGADDVCRQFETGGGRKAAAGINRLPKTEYDRFISVMEDVF